MGNAYRSVLAGGGAGTPITPSNLSPANMEQGETYTPTANGKAVESVTDIIPSNSNPPALSADNIYKPGESGYAIGSYSNISPSSSGTYFSSGMKKMSSSGYAYSSQAKRIKRGTATLSNSNPTTISCGFKPSAVLVQIKTGNAYMFIATDTGGIESGYSWRGNVSGAGTSGWGHYVIPNTLSNCIREITNDGFIVGSINSNYGTSCSYLAVE